MAYNEKVIICEDCEGYGTIVKSELTDYHKGEYSSWREKCKSCNGKGRLIQAISITTKKLPKVKE